MVYRVYLNGNDPARHQEFLRRLRDAPDIAVRPHVRCARHEPLRKVPQAYPALDDVLDALVRDTQTIIELHPEDGIVIETEGASIDRYPGLFWRVECQGIWTPQAHETITALVRDTYGVVQPRDRYSPPERI